MKDVPIEVSARHIHFSEEDFKKLFGERARLDKLSDLSQPGEYACKETVILIGPKGRLKKVRVLGPFREKTQVEISLTDSRVLGVKPPIRLSGDTEQSESITILGPEDRKIKIRWGVIIAKRHIHISQEEALDLKLVNGEKVSVETFGKRSLVFHEVVVRVAPNYKMAFHIDADEANAAGVKTGSIGNLITHH